MRPPPSGSLIRLGFTRNIYKFGLESAGGAIPVKSATLQVTKRVCQPLVNKGNIEKMSLVVTEKYVYYCSRNKRISEHNLRNYFWIQMCSLHRNNNAVV